MQDYEMRTYVAESAASNYVGEIMLPNDTPFSNLSPEELNQQMPGFGIFEVGFANYFNEREGFFPNKEEIQDNPFIIRFETFRDYPAINHEPDNPKAFLDKLESEVMNLSTILYPDWGPQVWRFERYIL